MVQAGVAQRFIEVLVEPNPACEDGFAMRFKAESEPREVSRVRWYDDAERAVECTVMGWSSLDGGSPVAAQAVSFEDSSAGAAVLVWGGDWGVRLIPDDGSAPFGESHLRLSPEDVLE
jgi:hypothetical protein